MAGTDSGDGLVTITVPEREDARELAEELADRGYAPCTVHRDLLAGDDDDEDADWVVEIRTGPHGGPAVFEEPHLGSLAEDYGGFVTVESG